MGYRYSLAFLTVQELSPPQAVRVAAEAGFEMVGVRLLPAGTDGPYPLLTDDALLAETVAAVEETGVAIADLEIVKLVPEFDLDAHMPFLERGARLGAKHILTAGYDPEPARLVENWGRFCEAAAAHGLSSDMEFMPWTDVPNAKTAWDLWTQVAHPAAGILVDALHVQRSDSPFETLAALPPQALRYAQLCDAPGVFDPAPEALIATARGARMMPGDGDFDFAAMLAALPKDLVLSVEVAQAARVGRDPAIDRAREALTKAKAVVAAAEVGAA